MKIYIEGSIEEIDEFLYGDGVEVVEAEEDGKCKCNDMSPDERLKLNLTNAFANTIDALINAKPQG